MTVRPAPAPRILWAAALVGAVVLALAACGPSAPGSAASGAPGAGAGAIDVTAVDYRFEPSSLTAQAGSVTFQVHNAGAAEHEFEVMQGDNVLGEVEGLVPGLTKSVTVSLAPGTYTYICRLAGHDQLGMKGTLVVN